MIAGLNWTEVSICDLNDPLFNSTDFIKYLFGAKCSASDETGHRLGAKGSVSEATLTLVSKTS